MLPSEHDPDRAVSQKAQSLAGNANNPFRRFQKPNTRATGDLLTERSAEVPVPELPKTASPDQKRAWSRATVSQRLAILMYLLRNHQLNEYGEIRLLRIQEWIPNEGLEAAFRILQKLELASKDKMKISHKDPNSFMHSMKRNEEIVSSRRLLGSLKLAIEYANTFCRKPKPKPVRKGQRVRGYRDKGTLRNVSSSARAQAAREYSELLEYPNDCYPPAFLRYLGTLYPSQVINLLEYHCPPKFGDCPSFYNKDFERPSESLSQKLSGQ